MPTIINVYNATKKSLPFKASTGKWQVTAQPDTCKCRHYRVSEAQAISPVLGRVWRHCHLELSTV